MSLKDEIDKLIAAERETLAKRDIEDRNFHEQQKAHFLPLRAVLEEMIKAVDPAYLVVGLGVKQATIKVGEYKGNRFEADIEWVISCWPDESPDGEELEQWVFSIVETTILSYSKEHMLNKYKFETVEEVIQHLVKKVAEQIAKYQHS